MAGCSSPEDDSSSSEILDVVRRLQSIDFCRNVDLTADGCRFEQILSVFLKEIDCKRGIRPFPALLGDGRPVDLWKLYCLVMEMGGYASVTAGGSWAVVAERIVLDPALGPPVKLIYARYLDALERCLHRVTPTLTNGISRGYPQYGEKLGGLSNSERCSKKQEKEEDAAFKMSPCSKKDRFLTPEREKNARRVILGNAECDKSNRSAASSASVMKSPPNAASSSLKRKREPLVGLLNWIRTVAKNPGYSSIGNVTSPNSTKAVDSTVSEQYYQSLEARKTLFLKKIPRDASAVQKGQTTHSSINNKYILSASPSIKSLRYSQRTHSSDMASCSTSCHINPTKQKLRSRSLFLPDYLADYEPVRIPIGSSFQAKVPAWTSKHSPTSYESNNLKWLGKRIWPPEDHKKQLIAEQNIFGKGRGGSCKCRNPGSIDCVRFHIAEKRLQLKCELGPVFYSWGFHCMGEEVALLWKEEEERRFKSTIHQNLAIGKDFWNPLRLCFPSKGNRSLVSYFFNVFLLTCRSYQNRSAPDNIDSDDENTNCDFLRCHAGYDAIRFHDPRSICMQNLQCIDVDD
ncbi:AT-rich interactive domain-containing protein 2 [Apostasia shenzhenica]|uniref:AT-rich interactive domain-containing protein 2 n=1 Tax=Apostasia shenzhenica TaxID=1088818 RepID=A0A2H9ZRE9_9ASPA|nr:AT-rich interactive domain-containing protein 2 [Apostasia shenzhenica]